MIYSLVLTMIGVFAASVLRGFTGFGFGLAGVPLLSVALSPAEAVPLVTMLQVVIGLAGFRQAAGACDWRSVRLLLPGLVAGVPAGLMILTALPPNPVRLLIGGIILGSVALIQRGARLPEQPPAYLAAGVGLASGVINGLASMGGPPVVVYLLALGHSAARLRATSIVYFMLASCVTLAPMAWRGLITREILLWSAISVPVLLAGTRIGSWAFHEAHPSRHRLTALLTLAVLGVMLIARALFSA